MTPRLWNLVGIEILNTPKMAEILAYRIAIKVIESNIKAIAGKTVTAMGD